MALMAKVKACQALKVSNFGLMVEQFINYNIMLKGTSENDLYDVMQTISTNLKVRLENSNNG